MAKWQKLRPTQEEGMTQWLAARPKVIQDMVAKYNLRIDTLYRLKTTGQRVVLFSLHENYTLTVQIFSAFNMDNAMARALGSAWDRRVFGIDPEDLEECDLPEGVVLEDNSMEIDLDDEGMKKILRT